MLYHAALTLIYGLALTTLTMFWLRRCGVPWRGAARALVFFLLVPLLMLPAGVVAGALHFAMPIPVEIWAVPLEEAAKLAVIVRLGARGRTAVAVCVLFGCVEMVLSKALLALMVSGTPLWFWMPSITLVVLAHGATGLVYAGIARVRRWYLFLFAGSLHLANNLGALWMVDHVENFPQALAMQFSMVAAVIAAAILFREWAFGRSPVSATSIDGDGLAARAPIV